MPGDTPQQTAQPAATPQPQQSAPTATQGAQQQQPAQPSRADAIAAVAAKRAGQPAPAPTQGGQPPPQQTQEPQKPTSDDGQFPRLARQLRAQELELKQLKADRDKLAERAAILDKIADPKQRWKALEELKVDYAEWTNHILQLQGHEPEQKQYAELPPEVQQTLEELRTKVKSFEERDKQQAQQQQQTQQQQQLERAINTVKEQLSAEQVADSFGFTNALGTYHAVVVRYQQKAQEDGFAPELADVAKAYERDLEQTIEKQIRSLVERPALRAKLLEWLGQQANPPATQGDPRPVGNGAPPVISNTVASQTGDGFDGAKASPAELRARGIQKMRALRTNGAA